MPTLTDPVLGEWKGKLSTQEADDAGLLAAEEAARFASEEAARAVYEAVLRAAESAWRDGKGQAHVEAAAALKAEELLNGEQCEVPIKHYKGIWALSTA